jgi:hypothetical protein
LGHAAWADESRNAEAMKDFMDSRAENEREDGRDEI